MKERLQVDRREIVYEADPEAIRELERLRPSWFESEIRLAKLFARIDGKAAYIGIRAASLEELAARRGYDAPRAYELALLGHALAGIPELERKLREGSVSFHAATVLGYVYRDPLYLQEGDDWLALAEHKSFGDLWRRIRRRLESVRHGAPANRTLRLDLPEEAVEDIREAQELAIKRAGEGVSKGQLFHALAVFFLRRLDPLWKPRRKRRMGPTRELPWLRGVAEETRRELKRRSGGKCEFGPCGRVAEELCHLVRHAEGSGREVHDLVSACRIHHKLYEMGKIRFLAWTKDEGLPLFRDALTGELFVPKPRPEEEARKPFPRWLEKIVGIVRRRRRSQPVPAAREASETPETPESARRVRARGRPTGPSRGERPAVVIVPEEETPPETVHAAAPEPPPRERPLPPGTGVARERGPTLRSPRPRAPRLRPRTYEDVLAEPPPHHLLL